MTALPSSDSILTLVSDIVKPWTLSVVTGDRGSGHTDTSFVLIDEAMRADPTLHLVLAGSPLTQDMVQRWGRRVSSVNSVVPLLRVILGCAKRAAHVLVYFESCGFWANSKRRLGRWSGLTPDGMLALLLNREQWKGATISVMLDGSSFAACSYKDIVPFPPQSIRYGPFITRVGSAVAGRGLAVLTDGPDVTEFVYLNIPRTKVRYDSRAMSGFDPSFGWGALPGLLEAR